MNRSVEVGRIYNGHSFVAARVQVFKLNVSLYPKSANTHFKLAMAYEAVGDKALAVKNFKLCLELDPTNKTALEHLENLNGKYD